MTDKENGIAAFELEDGDLKVWEEAGEICFIAADPRYRDPVELTTDMARDLASALQSMAEHVRGGSRASRLDKEVLEVWIEQEEIHIKAMDLSSGGPVKLTADAAIELALALQEMADKFDGPQ
ncbi:MAG TPA: hypothetical protein VF173_31610 [Thermoanaerobaculia bacterium]|nr:hypothetical protein [Thermoanaerobaculia bacterium]